MAKVTIFHNNRCTKSRQTLALIEDQGIAPEVVDYINDPISKTRLKELLKLLGMKPAQLIRKADAKKAGVDPKLVFDAIKGGLAGSTVMNAKIPMILEGNFKPGFKIDLHIKDLNNALETAHSVGSPLPLSASVMEMMQTLHADGCGQDDHCGIAQYYYKVSGDRIGK